MRFPEHLKRVWVVGSSCSGKSTFARRLAELTGNRHVQIDELNWLPGWQMRPTPELRELIRDEAGSEEWIIDGNYERTSDIVLQRATALAWLDYSFPLVMYRAFSRTVRRVIFRERLYAGNRESFRLSFLSRESVLLWVIRRYRVRKQQYNALMRDPRHREIRFLRFKTPSETEAFLRGIKGRDRQN